MFKKVITAFLILVLTVSACQITTEKDPNLSTSTSLRISSDSLLKALFQQTVWVIHQDQKQNYWFGTQENGVFKYDGKQMQHYTTHNGLISNDVRRIQEDNQGVLYFDTDAGVSRLEGDTFYTLPLYTIQEPLPQWKLLPSDLWFRIGFNHNGVYRYDGEFLHFLPFPKSPKEDHSSFDNNVYGLYTIYKDLKGHMWFGTASLGVLYYNGDSFGWYFEDQLQTTPNGGDFGTRAILEDREGKYWINNTRFMYSNPIINKGDIAFEKQSGVGEQKRNIEKEFFPYYQSIVEDEKGHIWMATYNDGVYKYNGKILVHYPVKEKGINLNLISIYKDQNNKIWVGTFHHGVYQFNGCHFVNPFNNVKK